MKQADSTAVSVHIPHAVFGSQHKNCILVFYRQCNSKNTHGT